MPVRMRFALAPLVAFTSLLAASSPALFAYQYQPSPYGALPMPGPDPTPAPPARITPNVSTLAPTVPTESFEQQNLEQRQREERLREQTRRREREAATGGAVAPNFTLPSVDLTPSHFDISQTTDRDTPEWKRLRDEREQLRLEREDLERQRRELDDLQQERQTKRIPLEGAADLKKFVFRGELSNFVLDKERGTGAFLFRDAQHVPQLYVVRLRYKSTDSRGYVRYESVGQEGTVTDWALYCGAADTTIDGAAGSPASAASVSAGAGLTGSYPIYLSLDNGKTWHQYETAARRAAN